MAMAHKTTRAKHHDYRWTLMYIAVMVTLAVVLLLKGFGWI